MRLTRKENTKEAILLLLPTVLIYTLVIVYPLANMFYTSFFEWNGIPSCPYEFVGLGNYSRLFSDVITKTAIKNVLIIMVISVVGVVPISLFLATVISKKFFGVRAVKASYFMPVVINKVAIGLMFTFIFYPKVGPFVKFLSAIGLDKGINFLGNMKTSIWVCAFAVLWCNTGFHMILFSSAMTQIPPELNEAAEIDGASPMDRFRFVTLPMLRGTIRMSVILLMTNAFKVFDLIKALTDGGPGFSSQVLTTLIYKNAFYYGEFGYADTLGAITVIFSIIIMIVVNTLFKLRSRDEFEGVI